MVIQDVSGIGQILDYMYTSHLDINQDNVQALLDIALGLQVPNIQSMCNAFLKPCPPPEEISSFSLPGMLSSEHNCLLGSSIAHGIVVSFIFFSFKALVPLSDSKAASRVLTLPPPLQPGVNFLNQLVFTHPLQTHACLEQS